MPAWIPTVVNLGLAIIEAPHGNLILAINMWRIGNYL